MKKYRKKPLIVEAVQWTGQNTEEIKTWSGNRIVSIPFSTSSPSKLFSPTRYCLQLRTLEGTMIIIIGDWIIKGIKGEFYGCKPDIFEQTYEEEQ